MLRSILYLLRIAPGYDVEDMDGIPGKDFGPNWIRGLLFYLYCLKWRRDEYVRVEYFFEYVHYITVERWNASGDPSGLGEGQERCLKLPQDPDW